MLGWCSYRTRGPICPSITTLASLEIHFLERGQQVFEVEGQEYELHGGDLFVTQPGEAHSTGGKPVEPCVLYWVNVRLPKRGQPLLLLPPKETAELVEALRSLPSRHFRAGPQIKALFDHFLAAAFIYLIFLAISNVVFARLERRAARGVAAS